MLTSFRALTPSPISTISEVVASSNTQTGIAFNLTGTTPMVTPFNSGIFNSRNALFKSINSLFAVFKLFCILHLNTNTVTRHPLRSEPTERFFFYLYSHFNPQLFHPFGWWWWCGIGHERPGLREVIQVGGNPNIQYNPKWCGGAGQLTKLW